MPALLAIALLPACSRGRPSPPPGLPGDGTRRMAERLQQLARATSVMENPFMNAARAEHLRAELEGTFSPQAYFELQAHYAEELMKSGKVQESIQALIDLQKTAEGSATPPNARSRSFMRHELALAYLRLGEQENCQAHHNTESCLMPIRGGGVHGRARGSTEATRILLEQLREHPGDLDARWWLNIAAMTLGDYPDKVPPQWLIPPSAFASDYDIKPFHDVAGALGVDVDDLAGGSIAEDFDGDGYLDIMASSNGTHGQLRLFHNNADGTFSERTAQAGLTGEVWSLNILQTDYDNDGHPDVLMLRGGWLEKAGHLPHSLLRNNGDGTFEDVTEKAGLLSLRPTQTATWLDYDNDGRLDLFVGTESEKDDPNPSELYHNNGDGTFSECAAAAGLTIGCYVKGVASGDYNNDGRPDLYVSCRQEPNLLFRNDGPKPGGAGPTEWQFTDVSAAAGVTEPVKSFPAWFFDYDNDGWLDIFVSGYDSRSVGDFAADYLRLPNPGVQPRLYHNERDGTFKDVTRQAHLDRVLLSMGSNYGDLDNDGWLDFYVGTGNPNLGTLIPNRMFRNAGGRAFQDVTTSGGFGHLQKGHGVSFADFDNDGDEDIYEVMGGVYEGDSYRNVLYENPGHGNHWITLALEGVRSNRPGIGARIRVTVDTPGGPREIHRSVSTGGSFGCSPLRQHIGLGDARSIAEVRVTWPASGIVQTFRNVGMDAFYRVREDRPDLVPFTLKTFTLGTRPMVADASR